MAKIRPEDYPLIPAPVVEEFESARVEFAGYSPLVRARYYEARALGMGHVDAVAYVHRHQAIRLRWNRDSKECGRCGHMVLWRMEQKRSVSLDRSGRLHACPEE